MPPLPAPEIQVNRGLSQLGLEAYPTTTGDVLDVTAEDAWVRNPTPSIGREFARQPEREVLGTESEFGTMLEPGRITEPLLDPEQANVKWGIKDHLKFDQDVPERVAQDLHDLKRDELRRKNVLRRAEGGVGETIAQFGVGLGVSILDPLNVASAFVPVVGQARAASMLARAGEGVLARAGARAQIGAVEGLAGAALLEPIVYGVAQSEQADYDTTDSLLNLAFGTVIGGGFHAGLGRLGDIIRDRGVAESTLRDAIAAVVEDRPVTASTMLRVKLLSSSDRNLSDVFDELLPPELKGDSSARLKSAEHELADLRLPVGITPDGPASRLGVTPRDGQMEEIGALRRETAEIEARLADLPEIPAERLTLAARMAEIERQIAAPETTKAEARKLRQRRDEMAVAADPADLRRDVSLAEARRAAEAQKENIASRIAEIESSIRGQSVGLEGIAAAERRIAGIQAEREAAVKQAQKAAMAELRREIAEFARPMSRSDEAEVQAIDAVLRTPEAKTSGGDMTALQADLEAMNKQIGEFRKSGVIPEAELRALDEADEMIRRAELRAKATEAAGACEMVRG